MSAVGNDDVRKNIAPCCWNADLEQALAAI
jgi:hypothetical protein